MAMSRNEAARWRNDPREPLAIARYCLHAGRMLAERGVRLPLWKDLRRDQRDGWRYDVRIGS